MQKIKKKTINFSSLLMGANVVVICLNIYAFYVKGANNYINANTILLAICVAIQTHTALFFENHRRDPFVFLLALTMIFYFSFRIFTLCIYSYSTVFQRQSFGVSDSNFALAFILVANTFLYLGFFAIRDRIQSIHADDWVPQDIWRAFALIALGILFFYTRDNFWTGENIPRTFRFLELFVSPGAILAMAISYCTLLRKSLSSWAFWAIAALLAVDAILHTLAGSRSAIVEIPNGVIIVLLALSGNIAIGRRMSVVVIVLLPALIALLMTLFTFASIMRGTKTGITTPYADVVRAIRLYNTPELKLSNFNQTLPPLFDRIGFFDYAAEIIAHRDSYASVVNIEAYAKSLVDNLLTPGFDIFDQPKIANSLKFVYRHLGQPSKREVAANYQSDQLSIYGELYTLLGYFSLPLFFLIAFFLKKFYVAIKSENPFFFLMKRTVVLYFFLRIINSFGVDWILIETLIFALSIYLYTFMFRLKKIDRCSPIVYWSGQTSEQKIMCR